MSDSKLHKISSSLSKLALTIEQQIVRAVRDVNPTSAYALATQTSKPHHIRILENVIVDANDAEEAYRFARFINNADVKKLEQVVLQLGDSELAYKFAKDVVGADIKALEQIVLNSNDPKLAYLFVKNIKSSDKRAFGKVVLNSANEKLIHLFALDVRGISQFNEWKRFLR